MVESLIYYALLGIRWSEYFMVDVIDVNADNWKEEVLESDVLTVVDFWHDRCPWCIKLEPIINEVAKEYRNKIKFVKLNVLESNENRNLAMKYGVMSTPTLLFFCAGRPIEGVVGFMSKEKLEAILEDLIERHNECVKQSSELG